jgi:hypothetical protein
VAARLFELGPKINRLSCLIEAFLCWRSVSLRQNGVGTVSFMADAILPKGHEMLLHLAQRELRKGKM